MPEIYIHANKIEFYATAQTTIQANIKLHGLLEGIIYLNGIGTKVIFDARMSGVNIFSTSFVTTHWITYIDMAKPTRIHIAMKVARSEKQEKCQIEVPFRKMNIPNTKMIIGDRAK